MVESYTPSSYKASASSIAFGDSETVVGAMSSAARYDTIYSYRPSAYVASKYTQESHSYYASSYSASSATQQSKACYVKNSSGGYSLAAQAYRWWTGYSASSYTASRHSYTPSSYTASSYVASSLVKKPVKINYTPSEYTKSALKVRPVTLELGFFRTRNVTALTV